MLTITAVEIAKRAGIDSKKLRKALRVHQDDVDIKWHRRGDPWTAEMRSDRHAAMERVLTELLTKTHLRRN